MLKPGSFQEKILVAKLKLKDKEAYSKLYDVYIDKIYRFIYFKVSNKTEAEDLTSQVFLKLWQQAIAEKIKPGQSFQSFLYKIARNLVIDYYRDAEKDKIKVPLREALDIAESGATTEEKLDQQENIAKIEEKLKRLKEEYREIIILHYIDELSNKEIAEVLNKAKGTVRITLHRALNALKKL